VRGEDMNKTNNTIVYTHPKSIISEAYRRLRTSIQFANLDKNLKTIMVTSSVAGEGKTTTLINLAVAMEQNHHKVLIMDCDLRKPKIHKYLGLLNNHGLSDMLLRGGDQQEYIQHHNELNLDILTSGRIPSNPSELLNSMLMKDLVKELSEKYDYILVDSPPVLPVADSVIMSGYIDGIIMVVAYGKVDKEIAKRSKEMLTDVNANILGAVLNKIEIKNVKAYKSNYYYANDTESRTIGKGFWERLRKSGDGLLKKEQRSKNPVSEAFKNV